MGNLVIELHIFCRMLDKGDTDIDIQFYCLHAACSGIRIPSHPNSDLQNTMQMFYILAFVLVQLILIYCFTVLVIPYFRFYIGDKYVQYAGYNEIGELNNIIIVYPQAVASSILLNLNGCWDWWGYTGTYYGNTYI